MFITDFLSRVKLLLYDYYRLLSRVKLLLYAYYRLFYLELNYCYMLITDFLSRVKLLLYAYYRLFSISTTYNCRLSLNHSRCIVWLLFWLFVEFIWLWLMNSFFRPIGVRPCCRCDTNPHRSACHWHDTTVCCSHHLIVIFLTHELPQ
jgi:hypothetical protein